MRIQRSTTALILATVLVAGLSACQKKDETGAGPAETAGKQIDQAAAVTNEKLEHAGEKISAGAVELTRKAGEKMEQAGEKMQHSSSNADKDAR